MCCRCPPSVGVYSYIYILLTVVVTFYFQHAKSIYLTKLEYIDVDSMMDCDGFVNRNFTLELRIENENRSMGNSRENVSFDSDENVEITMKGNTATGADAAMKTYINNKSFCKIMDNYIYYHIGESGQRPVSFCPFQSGFREIYDDNPEFNDVAMPYEMFAHKTFRLELIRHGEKIACKQFQFINGVGDNGLWEENDS
ncbi:uncharacterized protein LOC123311132 [Coccinella septempunctata]|uniref:uncharacterized protein LOC123311132 n=1 Tax=Coccinella septempunctata TaxID=41139 RepID=UPI001D070D77|nr:uncharacterized protein LOC123311132 [Coccinella septempunctata]